MKLGTIDISALKLGTVDVQKVMLGDVEVWNFNVGGYEDLNLYVTRTIRVRVIDKANLTYLGESPSYSGTIRSVIADEQYIYYAGSTNRTVVKSTKDTTPVVIGSTAEYGGTINAISIDAEYIYAVGLTTRRIRKYDKSTLAFVGESAAEVYDLNAIDVDDTHIYIGHGGTINPKVRKFDKSTLAYITESTVTMTNYQIKLDGDFIYAAGTGYVRKYNKSDLANVANYVYGTTSNIVRTLDVDDTHVYASGAGVRRVVKLLKSNLNFVSQSALYGTTSTHIIWGLKVNDTHVYAGGVTYRRVVKYLKSDLSTVTELNLEGDIRALSLGYDQR